MKTKNYNLIPLSIDHGLNAVQIGTAGGYIRLLEAPSTANVFIHLNEKNADPIPLKVYHAIEATNIERIYVTCNAVAGEIIKIVQANSSEDFKMVTPASDVKLSELGGYESTALAQMQQVADNAVLSSTTLAQLDKIINQYSKPTLSVGSSADTSGSLVTIFSKNVICDKIKVNMLITDQNLRMLGQGGICLFHNGEKKICAGGWNDSNVNNAIQAVDTFEVNSGDLIEIICFVYSGYTVHFNLQEYTLK